MGAWQSIRRLLFAGTLALTVGLPAAPAGAYIYWGNGEGTGTGSVGRANLDGSSVNNSFVTGTPGVCGVAVDASHIYWASGGGQDFIGRANIDGSGVNNSFIVPTNAAPCGVAVDSAHVYFNNFAIPAIGRANLDGSGVNQSFVTGTGANTQHPDVDGAHIYWSEKDGHAIGRANLDGTGVNASFITGTHTNPSGVVTDGTYVYWGNGTSIGRANLDGSSPNQTFIATTGFPCDIAVDSGHIYWSQYGGSIGRANLDGTGANPNFITTAGHTCGVAVDSGGPPPAGGGGSGDPTTTSIGCNRGPNPGDPYTCTIQVSDGAAANATAPGGQVTVSTNNGGSFGLGSSCALAASPTLPTVSACSVTFSAAPGTTTLTAAYPGDAAHAASSGTFQIDVAPPACSDSVSALEGTCTSDPAFTNAIVCHDLFVDDCAAFGSPDPVQVCVSAWEDCNGFGGAKPAKPGTIDLSGFPSTVITKSGCAESQKDPFHPAVDDAASRRKIDCATQVLLKSDDPKARADAKQFLYYEENLQKFRAFADGQRGLLDGAIRDLLANAGFEQILARDGETASLAVRTTASAQLSTDFDAAETEGQPVNDQKAVFNPTAVCAVLSPPAQPQCRAYFDDVRRMLGSILTSLKSYKHLLGVDTPYDGGCPCGKARDGADAARGTAKRRRIARGITRRSVMIAYGVATTKQGTSGRLKLALSPASRRLLRRLRRSGVTTIRAQAVIVSTIIPGVTTRKVVPIRISLVPLRRHRR